MLRFLFTRLSLIIPTFFGMTLVAFFLIRLVPGDPIETLAGERGIDAERHAVLLKEYGLDRPIITQYGIYIAKERQLAEVFGTPMRMDFDMPRNSLIVENTEPLPLLEGFEGDLDGQAHRGGTSGWRLRGLPWQQG